jgi:putative hydrolase of the HAD superfamily
MAERRGLVLDFGGPVLVTPFELVESSERRLGVAPGTLGWRGPFDPAADRDWQDVLGGRLGEKQYWLDRAAEFGRLTGNPDAGFRDLIPFMFAEDESVLVRPGALALINDTRAAGLPVGVLTNDLRLFHSDEWVESLKVLTLMDAVIDASRVGISKPDPRVYRIAAAELGIDVEEAVFVDDQPVNIAGAAAVGMYTVFFDPTDPVAGYDRARELLGIAAG